MSASGRLAGAGLLRSGGELALVEPELDQTAMCADDEAAGFGPGQGGDVGAQIDSGHEVQSVD